MRYPVRRRPAKPVLPITITPLPGGLGVALDLGPLLWELQVQEVLRELGMK